MTMKRTVSLGRINRLFGMVFHEPIKESLIKTAQS